MRPAEGLHADRFEGRQGASGRRARKREAPQQTGGVTARIGRAAGTVAVPTTLSEVGWAYPAGSVTLPLTKEASVSVHAAVSSGQPNPINTGEARDNRTTGDQWHQDGRTATRGRSRPPGRRPENHPARRRRNGLESQ
jgi:hypothetical protein